MKIPHKATDTKLRTRGAYLTATSGCVAVRFGIRHLGKFVFRFTTTKTITQIASANSCVGGATYTIADPRHSFCVWRNSVWAQWDCVWKAVGLVVEIRIKMGDAFYTNRSHRLWGSEISKIRFRAF